MGGAKTDQDKEDLEWAERTARAMKLDTLTPEQRQQIPSRPYSEFRKDVERALTEAHQNLGKGRVE